MQQGQTAANPVIAGNALPLAASATNSSGSALEAGSVHPGQCLPAARQQQAVGFTGHASCHGVHDQVQLPGVGNIGFWPASESASDRNSSLDKAHSPLSTVQHAGLLTSLLTNSHTASKSAAAAAPTAVHPTGATGGPVQQGYSTKAADHATLSSSPGTHSAARSPRHPPSVTPSFPPASRRASSDDDSGDDSDEDDRLSTTPSRGSYSIRGRTAAVAAAEAAIAAARRASYAAASRPQSPRGTAPPADFHVELQQLRGDTLGRGAGQSNDAAPGKLDRLESMAACAASFNMDAAAQQHLQGQQQEQQQDAAAAAAAPDAEKPEDKDGLKQEFQNLALFDDDEEDDDIAAEVKRPWYQRWTTWTHVVAFLLAVALLVIGLCSQFLVTSWQSTSAKNSIELFRWMYFFAFWPVLWVVVDAVNHRVFRLIEWLFYRDALYYLDSLRRTARNLGFALMVLPWYKIIFEVAWCDDACSGVTYRQYADTLWKLVLCLMFLTLANFLKALVTKFLSINFYRTAHFKKVKQAIEKEYYLMMLSQPRPHKPEPELHHTTSIFGTVLLKRPTAGLDGSPMHSQGGTLLLQAHADGSPGHQKSRSLDLQELSFGSGALRSLATRSLNKLRLYGGHNAPDMPDQPGEPHQQGPRPGRSKSAAQLHTPHSRSSILAPVSQHSGTAAPTAEVGSAASPAEGMSQQQMMMQQVPAATACDPSTVQLHTAATQQSLLAPAPAELDPQQPGGCLWWRGRDRSHQPANPWIPTHFAPPTTTAAAGSTIPAAGEGGQYRSTSGTSPLRAIPEGRVPAALPTTGLHGVDGLAAAGGVVPRLPSVRISAGVGGAGGGGLPPQAPTTESRVGAMLRAASGKLKGGSHAEGSVSSDKAAARDSSAGQQPPVSGVGRKVSAGAGSGQAPAPDDPLLQPEVLKTVNIKMDGKKVNLTNMSQAEWERLRTGIALKTFTALMTRYQNMTEAEETRKLKEARRFAKGLFFHVKEDLDRPFLLRSDFDPFFTSRDMADQAFSYFDKDNDARLSLKEMKESVVSIFKERKNMASSLKDTDSIVNTLEFGIGVACHFLFIAIYLVVWNVDIMKGFSTFSATVLALTFIFGNSVRQVYESMLFLFVEHAYDVGDLLEVEANQYRVKKIDLMYTLMVKTSGEHSYYPNTRLITLPVLNLTRSTARSDKVVFSLNVGKSAAAAKAALTAAIKKHHEANASDFASCPSVNFAGLVDPFKVQLQVSWSYSFGPDEGKRASSVKTALLSEVNQVLGSVPLDYTYVQHGIQQELDDSDLDEPAAAASVGAAAADNPFSGLRPDTGVPFLLGTPAGAIAAADGPAPKK